MPTEPDVQYLQSLADFLTRDLTSAAPIRVQGALRRIRRAIPALAAVPDTEAIAHFRRTDALDVIAREQGASSWRSLAAGEISVVAAVEYPVPEPSALSTDRLEPCPFCGGAKAIVSDEVIGPPETEHTGVWSVACDDCTARGPEEGSREAAIRAWNAQSRGEGSTGSEGATVLLRHALKQYVALDNDRRAGVRITLDRWGECHQDAQRALGASGPIDVHVQTVVVLNEGLLERVGVYASPIESEAVEAGQADFLAECESALGDEEFEQRKKRALRERFCEGGDVMVFLANTHRASLG